METQRDSINIDNDGDNNLRSKVWGTEEYERALYARYPSANSSMINSLIKTTRRIAEKERCSRQN